MMGRFKEKPSVTPPSSSNPTPFVKEGNDEWNIIQNHRNRCHALQEPATHIQHPSPMVILDIQPLQEISVSQSLLVFSSILESSPDSRLTSI